MTTRRGSWQSLFGVILCLGVAIAAVAKDDRRPFFNARTVSGFSGETNVNLIFIHGWLSDAAVWSKSVAYFRQHHQDAISQVLVVDYNWRASLDESASQCQEILKIENGLFAGEEPEVFLICHSMGGLVAVRALNMLAAAGADYSHIKKVICIATPHKGAGLAILPLLFADIRKRDSQEKYGHLLVGVGKTFPKGSVEFFHLAGTKDMIVSQDSAAGDIDPKDEKHFAKFPSGHSELPKSKEVLAKIAGWLWLDDPLALSGAIDKEAADNDEGEDQWTAPENTEKTKSPIPPIPPSIQKILEVFQPSQPLIIAAREIFLDRLPRTIVRTFSRSNDSRGYFYICLKRNTYHREKNQVHLVISRRHSAPWQIKEEAESTPNEKGLLATLITVIKISVLDTGKYQATALLNNKPIVNLPVFEFVVTP